jgi:hypothetical protein
MAYLCIGSALYHGESSVLNLLEVSSVQSHGEIGQPAPVVHFNRWLYSGTSALLRSFFRRLSDSAMQGKATV